MKMNTIPKDVLSSDVSNTRHEWDEGKWQPGLTGSSIRVDTCKHCGCIRHMISVSTFYGRRTEVMSYDRGNISFGKQRPPCWRDKNPK